VPLKPGLIALFDRCYDTILAEGLVFHEAHAPTLARDLPVFAKPDTPASILQSSR
jgi:hypothetical protein